MENVLIVSLEFEPKAGVWIPLRYDRPRYLHLINGFNGASTSYPLKMLLLF